MPGAGGEPTNTATLDYLLRIRPEFQSQTVEQRMLENLSAVLVEVRILRETVRRLREDLLGIDSPIANGPEVLAQFKRLTAGVEKRRR